MRTSIYLRFMGCPLKTCAMPIISESLTTCAVTGYLTAASKRFGLLFLCCLNTQTKSSWLQPTTRRCSLSDAIDRSGRITRSAGRKSTAYGSPWTVLASIRSLFCSIPGCAVAKCYSYKKLTSIFVNAISASHGAKPPLASASSPYIIESHHS